MYAVAKWKLMGWALMGLLEAQMAQKIGKTSQLTCALKVSTSSKDSFSHSCFSYILNAITSISVTCVLLFSCPRLNMSFFYFSSLIQPSLEEDVSTEILLANKKLRSTVWKEFELTMLDDGTYKAICKHCKKDFVAGNRAGTSHLKYHIGVCSKLQSKRRKFGSPKLDIPIFD